MSGRRGFLAGAAAMAGAGVPIAATAAGASANAAGPDAELIALCAAFDALERRYAALSDGPDAIRDDDAYRLAVAPIHDAMAVLLDRMALHRAATMGGIAARFRTMMLEDLEIQPAELIGSQYTNERLQGMFLRDFGYLVGFDRAAVPSPVAAAPPHPDARLVALAAELARLSRRLDDWNEERIGEEEGGAASDAWWAAVDAMAGVRATTDAGFRAKARAVTLALDTFPEASSVHELARGLCRDLLAGGEAA